MFGYKGALFGNGATPLLNTGATSIDATALPLDPTSKAPIYPHSDLRVNTIFEVIHSAGLRTAWCDKHAAYDLVTGPSGVGVDDIFTSLKVNAVVNEISGFDHTGATQATVPAIMGLNFQAVSDCQKLKGGGYLDPQGLLFSPTLATGLAGVDAGIGQIVAALKSARLLSSTLAVISAKHGQSPINQASLVHFDDSATTTLDPTNPSPTSVTEYLFANGIQAYTNANDTCYFLWLKDRTRTAAAVTLLQAAPAAKVGPVSSILSGSSLTAIFNDPTKDPRVPDIIMLPPAGTVYTGGSKIAEHGGFNKDDRSVSILLSNPGIKAATVTTPVMTTQVAPTILKALGMDPTKLQAVVAEGTSALPSLPD